MRTQSNYQNISETANQSFYLFECNSPMINRKFVAFVYGDYQEKLKGLETTMIFQVESALPETWNNDVFEELKQELLAYEIAHRQMPIPIYRTKHKLYIWDIIIRSVVKYSTSYIQLL